MTVISLANTEQATKPLNFFYNVNQLSTDMLNIKNNFLN